MKIYFVVNARIPTKKAYGIHVAKMSEAFLEVGNELILVIPHTKASAESVRAFYGLRCDVPVRILPSLDWYGKGRLGFIVSSVLFSVSCIFYFRTLNTEAKKGILYTTDMDSFSFSFLPYTGLPVFSEMHDWRGNTSYTRSFFRKVMGVVATNTETARRLQNSFNLPDSKICIEANGVDLQAFSHSHSKEESRTKLEINLDAKIALYLGRFYEWKGLSILLDAARMAPKISWYAVGGSREELLAATGAKDLPPNLLVPGECTLEKVPLWLAAADVLLIIGTKSNEQSYKHTSPMKVYEYMAAERPVVASATPALESIITKDEVFWCKPDDVASLRSSVQEAFKSYPESSMLIRAKQSAEEHSWTKRAQRITAFMEKQMQKKTNI
jgi:glycosyltransferase involved in cell wall biosynthesis